MLQLGGNIQLVGFKDFDYGEMVVIKKLVGNYARKLSEHCKAFEHITIHNKPIHQQEHSQKFEVHGKLVDGGHPISIEVTDYNFYVALDSVLKKLLAAVCEDS